MAEQPKMKITQKLYELMKTTGYMIVQHNGQRKYGPPPGWVGPSPEKGCEIFIGKLPRDMFEDELVPVFSSVGKIYEMRLMMDFSGSNRGYAFVTYTTKAEASAAVRKLNGYEIRPRRHIGVVLSVDNCRLFIGNIPKTMTKEKVLFELTKLVSGIVDVILYKNCYEKKFNRGFAFVEFTSHRAAAMARRALLPGFVKLLGQDIQVDWAEPEPQVDDADMQRVTVLYVRNFTIATTPDTIAQIFEAVINAKIERVKKIYDYAFIHFYERKHAELAMEKLQNANIDDSNIEISWAKPVDRELYRIQKQMKGNAKFNNSMDLSHTLLLYTQHLEKEPAICLKEDDEGVESTSGDFNFSAAFDVDCAAYKSAPAELEGMCKRFMWAPPQYKYRKYLGQMGAELWVGIVELPQVGGPLLTFQSSIGPMMTKYCFSMQEAHNEAAEIALNYIKMWMGQIHRYTPTPQTCHTIMQSPVQHVSPCDCALYTRHQPTLHVPATWRM